tara:strand:+ start:55 stop:237 length:183 start_codon:yes stop_codon:yes gene_type:complete
LTSKDSEATEKEFEELGNTTPTVFNIETTNYCNMKCVMGLGNVNENSLEEIWNGEKYKKF